MPHLRPDVLHNLPISMTSFVGRASEVQALTDLLTNFRLVTITGTSGSGKSRLALEVGHRLLARVFDAIWLIDLAPLSDAALLAHTLAAALGIRPTADQPIVELLAAHLHQRRALLILDNCEHLLLGCVALVQSLLKASPTLRILATSLEPLAIDGEVVWALAPLPTPEPVDLPSSAGRPLEEMLQYAAIALFLDRAQGVVPDFALTVQNANKVGQICRRLDGLPLAIELAARRVKMLSPDELLLRLEKGFDLLSSSASIGRMRHQTLRATIDWSYRFLTAAERRLWRRLSVFVSHFSLQAAEAVSAVEGGPPSDVLEVLAQLIDKSIVAVVPKGEDRYYRLLETIRAYGWEQAEAKGEAPMLRRRHRDWCLDFARQADAALTGSDQRLWLQRLSAVYENIPAALRWSLECDEIEEGLRLAGSLHRYWSMMGHFREAQGWLDRLLERTATYTTAWVKAACDAGVVHFRLGHYEQATHWYQQSLQMATALAEKQGMLRALHNLGVVTYAQSDYEMAQHHVEASLALSRDLRDMRAVATSLSMLGAIAYDQGAYEQAQAFYRESLVIYRTLGDQSNIALALGNLAVCTVQTTTNYHVPRQMFEESLSIRRKLGDTYGIAICLHGIGWFLRLERRYSQAQSTLKESLALFRDLEETRYIGITLLELATVLQGLHELDKATDAHRESLKLRLDIKHWSGIAESLEKVGALFALRKQAERAAFAFGAANGLRTSIKSPILPTEKIDYIEGMQTAQQLLSPDYFWREWHAGESLAPDEAVVRVQQWLAPVAEAEAVEATDGHVKVGGVTFTVREMEVIQLVAEGRTRKEIGERLYLSPRTVQMHEENIRRKLGIGTRAGLAAWAAEKGLLASALAAAPFARGDGS